MAKADNIELNGKVVDLLKGGQFKVKLENEHIITAYLNGKMRQNNIKIVVGDDVVVEVSPYDLSRGRIIWRHK